METACSSLEIAPPDWGPQRRQGAPRTVFGGAGAAALVAALLAALSPLLPGRTGVLMALMILLALLCSTALGRRRPLRPATGRAAAGRLTRRA